MAKINCSFFCHRVTDRQDKNYKPRNIYSTILKWEGGGGIETTNGKSGTYFLLLVIRSVSNVLRAQSRFVKFVCGGGGGGVPEHMSRFFVLHDAICHIL